MADTCYHCAEPIDDAYVWTIETNQQCLKFCCPACKTVFQCINERGLNQYYALRSEPAIRPVEQSVDYSTFDVLNASCDFVEDLNGNQQQAKLLIGGLHCSACAWLLERVLNKLNGVSKVQVNLHQRQLTIVWQAKLQKLSQLMQCIHDLGYEPQGWSGASRYAAYKKEKAILQQRLGVAGLLMMQVGMLSIGLYAGDWQGMDSGIQTLLRIASAALSSIAILYCATPFYRSAYRSLKHLAVNMDVPVVLALSVAYSASLYALISHKPAIYFDTVCMFVFFLLLSRYLETRSREPSQTSDITLLPVTAERRLLKPATEREFLTETVPVSTLQLGDIVLCRAASQVPADGEIVEAKSSFDESAFTGESLPRLHKVGDAILAGSMNIEQAVWLKVTAIGANSRIHKIENLLDTATASKPDYAATLDSLSPWFVMAVLLCSAASAIFWLFIDTDKALTASLAVLVVSCPCALSLATPSAIACAHRSLRKVGVVPISSRLLEQLPKISHVIFDKTGTLSTGIITLQHTTLVQTHLSEPAFIQSDVLQLAASLEIYSEHPIAKALGEANTLPLLSVSNVQVVVGSGVEGTINNRLYRVGSPKWCAELNSLVEQEGSQIVLCSSNAVFAQFYFDDSLREDAKPCVATLTKQGYNVSLLSGDNPSRVASAAQQLNIHNFTAKANPEQKLAVLQVLQSEGASVLMVGDGVNDSPVLAAANVSVAMFNANDLSKSKADAVLLSSQLQRIPLMIAFAQATRAIVRQNIFWAILYNGISMPLAAMALLPPWLAAIGMSVSSLVVVLNSQRLRRLGKL